MGRCKGLSRASLCSGESPAAPRKDTRARSAVQRSGERVSLRSKGSGSRAAVQRSGGSLYCVRRTYGPRYAQVRESCCATEGFWGPKACKPSPSSRASRWKLGREFSNPKGLKKCARASRASRESISAAPFGCRRESGPAPQLRLPMALVPQKALGTQARGRT